MFRSEPSHAGLIVIGLTMGLILLVYGAKLLLP